MKPHSHSSTNYTSLGSQETAQTDEINAEKRRSSTQSGDTELMHENAKPPSKKRQLRRRLGCQSLFTLFLGSLVLLLVIVFLGLLWDESIKAVDGEDPDSDRSWIKTFTTDWTTRTVTICSALIRTAMGFQASLVTSMLAGIILERIGTPLHKAAFYSIIRAVDVSPTNLLWAKKFQWRVWRVRKVNWFSFLIYTLIIVEVLVTIVAQFLSTIFLSDFSNATISSLLNTTLVPVFENNDITYTNFWSMPPVSSWAFAEAPSEPLIAASNHHDTGHTYRAFLPFEEDYQRTRLRRFHGQVPIMDHRVVCVNPGLTNLTLDADEQRAPRLLGQMNLSPASYPMLRRGAGEPDIDESVNFVCALSMPPEAALNRTDEKQTSICWPDTKSGWTISLEGHLVNPVIVSDSPGLKYNSPEYVTKGSTLFLVADVINSTGLVRGYGSEHDPKRLVIPSESSPKDGPWAVLTNGLKMEVLRVTACMTELSFTTYVADLHSSWDALEPRMALDRNKPGTHNTAASRRQLGASLHPDPFPARGILTLSPRTSWLKTNITTLNSSTDPTNPLDQWIPWYFTGTLASTLPVPQAIYSAASGMNNTALAPADRGVFLTSTRSTDAASAHLSHANLFHDVLADTNSPALAAQALLARITQMMYYDGIAAAAQGQSKQATAFTSFAVVGFLPVRWKGFAGGVAVVGVHLVVVGVVVGLWMGMTRYSFVGGGFWQAVGQVVNTGDEGVEGMVEGGGEMRDGEVKERARGKGVDVGRRGVLRKRGDGRIVVTVVDDDGERGGLERKLDKEQYY